MVEAYDVDDESNQENLSAQEYIGQLEFQLHSVVTAKDQCFASPLINPARKNNGILKITAEEKKIGGECACFAIQAEISAPGQLFYIIWKQLSPSKYKPVYKSEIQPE